jgi:hypothetical protein
MKTCFRCSKPLTENQILVLRMLWKKGYRKAKVYCEDCYDLLNPEYAKNRKEKESKRRKKCAARGR